MGDEHFITFMTSYPYHHETNTRSKMTNDITRIVYILRDFSSHLRFLIVCFRLGVGRRRIRLCTEKLPILRRNTSFDYLLTQDRGPGSPGETKGGSDVSFCSGSCMICDLCSSQFGKEGIVIETYTSTVRSFEYLVSWL